MRPEEVLRAAAGYIRAGGLSQGANCRDGNGEVVPLWVTGSSETGRAAPNPKAVSHSLYSAIVKAVHLAPDGVPKLMMIFDVSCRLASDVLEQPLGGNNHVHAVAELNEMEGFTTEAAAAFLEGCATECERIGDGPWEPPIVSPADGPRP